MVQRSERGKAFELFEHNMHDFSRVVASAMCIRLYSFAVPVMLNLESIRAFSRPALLVLEGVSVLAFLDWYLRCGCSRSAESRSLLPRQELSPEHGSHVALTREVGSACYENHRWPLQLRSPELGSNGCRYIYSSWRLSGSFHASRIWIFDTRKLSG